MARRKGLKPPKRVRLHRGKCEKVLRRYRSNSIDSFVTDPPYGLRFMGKKWDDMGSGAAQREWHKVWLKEAFRALKPGGYLIAFGGDRTYHHLASAVEEVGFEIRHCIQWLYGSGFPKSMNISKAIDKAAGAERKVIEKRRVSGGGMEHVNRTNATQGYRPSEYQKGVNVLDVTEPATPEAVRWDGWGTALKPAFEPIVVARKPLSGTVVANILEYGTGGLNIDGCVVPADGETIKTHSRSAEASDKSNRHVYGEYGPVETHQNKRQKKGRWPANVILSHSPRCTQKKCHRSCPIQALGDTARFYTHVEWREADFVPFLYQAKPSKKEREFGCDHLPGKSARTTVGRKPNSKGAKNPRAGAGRGAGSPIERCKLCGAPSGASADRGSRAKPCPKSKDGKCVPVIVGYTAGRKNYHPTVKPIALMQWLIRLVTPEGGVVVDPFCGSGTTGCAAMLEGMRFIGIEKTEEYLPIERARIQAHMRNPDTTPLLGANLQQPKKRKVPKRLRKRRNLPMPTVVNVRGSEKHTVYIGRAVGRDPQEITDPREAGYFGNPIVVNEPCPVCGKVHKKGSKTLKCYRKYARRRIKKDKTFRIAVMALRGEVLGCYCKPRPCHGDVLVELCVKLWRHAAPSSSIKKEQRKQSTNELW